MGVRRPWKYEAGCLAYWCMPVVYKLASEQKLKANFRP